jgi:RNA polymerase sigma-70 factor (ECF subfamily)
MNAPAQEPPGADAGNQGTMGDGEARMEWTLIQRVLSGEQKAFELLVVKYQKRIERLVTRMVRDPDLASDITQDAFLSAYRNLRQFRGDAQFYTWLHRIAVNTAYKALQAKKRDPVVFLSELLPENDAAEETFLEKQELTSQDTPEAMVAARQIAQAVEAAIGSLSQEYRQAWELREMEGLSYEEIAELAEIPVGTVRSRIFRAREAIAAKVGPLLEHRNGKRW